MSKYFDFIVNKRRQSTFQLHKNNLNVFVASFCFNSSCLLRVVSLCFWLRFNNMFYMKVIELSANLGQELPYIVGLQTELPFGKRDLAQLAKNTKAFRWTASLPLKKLPPQKEVFQSSSCRGYVNVSFGECMGIWIFVGREGRELFVIFIPLIGDGADHDIGEASTFLTGKPSACFSWNEKFGFRAWFGRKWPVNDDISLAYH